MITDGDIDQAIKFFDDPFGQNVQPKEKKIGDELEDGVDDESIELNLSRDKEVAAILQNSKSLPITCDKKLVKFQNFMLTGTNDEQQNVMHLACQIGDLKLVKFLLEKAGPKYLNVLSSIINSQDEMGLTPIYLLCRQGYSKKTKKNKELLAKGESPMEHKDRIEILKLLVMGYESQYSGAKVP